MSFFEEIKKSISEELAGEEINQKTGGDLTEPNQGEPITRKAKENSTENTTSIDMPILTKDNIEEYIKTCPRDEKDRAIVPDAVIDQYQKILPNGTRNESKSKMIMNGGILKPLGADPERDKEVQTAGANALNAKHAQRQSMAETLDILLRQAADPETIEALGLPAGATKQDAMLAAMYLQATEGNVKAGQFVRDTIGEQPTIKQEVDIMTDDDRKLLANISDRLT
jgi:hypothetical protein